MDDLTKTFLRVAGVVGFLAVMAGTFGAHGLPEDLDAHARDVFETGVRYHVYHAIALLACARCFRPGLPARLALWGFCLGILLFSGSLYALALSGVKALGMIAPIGGLCFLAGWLALVFEANRDTSA